MLFSTPSSTTNKLCGRNTRVNQELQTAPEMLLRARGTLAAVMFAAALIACGGGGGGGGGGTADPKTPLASAGVYYGRTPDVSPRNYPTLIIRSNGDFWVFNEVTNRSHGMGFGTATEQAFQINSTSYRYLSTSSGVTEGRLTGTYRARLSLGGTITYPAYNQSLAYESTYLSLPTLSIADLARTWTARDDTASTYNLAIASDGTFTASSGTCSISGAISTPDTGLAAAPVAARGSDGCRLAGQSMTGVIYSKVGDYWRDIWVGLIKSDRTDGMMLYVRQCLPGTEPLFCDP